MTINHGERAHARLSASGAERWLNCTPSVSLEETIPNKTANDYMLEGTLAHELSEVLIHHYAEVHQAPSMQARKAKLDQIKANRFYNADMNSTYMNIYNMYWNGTWRLKADLIARS